MATDSAHVESDPYVLVTAARNEAQFIGHTLQSIAEQTLLPRRWVVVSDGSTDATEAIVREMAEIHQFIRLVRIEGKDKRDFGGKVRGIDVGVAALADLNYEYIGVVDADVSLEREYYARAIARFEADPKLGLIGGVRYDKCGNDYRKVMADKESAGGPTQFFRRACYEQLGGYLPLRLGGVDAAAEAAAKMHGWSVRTFEDLVLKHHRRTGTEGGGILRARFRQGQIDRSLGYHPLFLAAKCIFRLGERPLILSGLLRGAGFVWAILRGDKPLTPPELVAFIQKDQLRRLNPFDRRKLSTPQRDVNKHGGS